MTLIVYTFASYCGDLSANALGETNVGTVQRLARMLMKDALLQSELYVVVVVTYLFEF